MSALESAGFFDFMCVQIDKCLISTNLLIIIIRFGGYCFSGPLLLPRLAFVTFTHVVTSQSSAP